MGGVATRSQDRFARSCVRSRPDPSSWNSVIWNGSQSKVANVVFADVQDRRGHKLLSIRDQNTFDLSLRRSG